MWRPGASRTLGEKAAPAGMCAWQGGRAQRSTTCQMVTVKAEARRLQGVGGEGGTCGGGKGRAGTSRRTPGLGRAAADQEAGARGRAASAGRRDAGRCAPWEQATASPAPGGCGVCRMQAPRLAGTRPSSPATTQHPASVPACRHPPVMNVKTSQRVPTAHSRHSQAASCTSASSAVSSSMTHTTARPAGGGQQTHSLTSGGSPAAQLARGARQSPMARPQGAGACEARQRQRAGPAPTVGVSDLGARLEDCDHSDGAHQQQPVDLCRGASGPRGRSCMLPLSRHAACCRSVVQGQARPVGRPTSRRAREPPWGQAGR